MIKYRTAKCSICGKVLRAKPFKGAIGEVRRHMYKDHRAIMVSRIKAGLKRSQDTNPSIQDLVSALRGGSVRSAMGVRHLMTEKRYQSAKVVLDALEPVMPNKMLIAWQAVEAVHDLVKHK